MFLKPDYNLENIYSINLEELKQLGIQAILFDLDSTIMASKSATYTPKTVEQLNNVRKDFFIGVVSNNKSEEYISKVRAISDFPLLFKASKPSTKEVKKFLHEHNLDAKNCALVGDRPLTDVLCGKRLGCKTILVDSITADTETKIVRLARKLERLCIR